MTYLSRNLIRQMILAEARRKKAPLLDPDFDFGDRTEDLTDTDLSRIEATDFVDIGEKTKIDTVPLSLQDLYDDEDAMAYDDSTEQGFSVVGIDDFEESEESESDTVENPLPLAAHDERFRFQPDMKSSVDPFGRTHGQIRQDVFDTYDDLYEPPTKKSKAQEEAEFLKQMEDMIALGKAATQFPTDPEFAPLDDSTLELPKDRFDKSDEDTKDMRETIKRLTVESVRNKLKKISKRKRY